MQNNNPLEALRNQLYSFMKRKDWSVTHLAVVSGISYVTLMNILTGRRENICISTIVKLSEGTGIPVNTLILGDSGEKGGSA